jgi:peptidoglycan/xylan/chitin deacetylase (PgdA/CDA1 family)
MIRHTGKMTGVQNFRSVFERVSAAEHDPRMTWKRNVLNAFGNVIPNFYHPPGRVLFPCGHTVGHIAPLHVRHLYKIPSPAKLKSDIDFLVQKYRPLQFSELERIGRFPEKKGPPTYFVLSFDDGMREVYDVIAPILREKGIPAIFFLNSATIDNKELMWRHKASLLIDRSQQEPARVPPQLSRYPGNTVGEKLLAVRFADKAILDEIAAFYEVDFNEYLRRNQPYLTTEQVLELASSGFEFGAHSASHPCFSEISVENQKEEILRSVSFIRALALPCRYFAFPFHDHEVTTGVFSYMRELELLLSFGTSDSRLDSVPFSFQRFALDAENSDLTLPEILNQLSAKSFMRRLTRTEVIHRN